MANPDTILHAIERGLKADADITPEMSYLCHEWDMASSEAFEEPPLTEISLLGDPERDGRTTTRIEDQFGGHIGELIRVSFRMDIQLDTFVVAHGNYDASKLGTDVRTALYRYDDVRGAEAAPLRGEPTQEYPEGVPLDSVTGVDVDLGSPRLDSDNNSTTRRWVNTVEVTFFEEVNSVEEWGPADYVESVVWAHDDQMVDGDKDGEVEYSARSHFP